MHDPLMQVFLIFTVGQGSLSFQLLGADGGLYDFGRAFSLLSTVTGLAVPFHNFIAVYKIKIVEIDTPVLLSVLFLWNLN